MVWCNYEWAWGGRYTHSDKEQSLNGCDILEHELQPIRFQGQFFDTETSLHYNRFRYYDSDVGMFISRDPIGLLGGSNVFQYAPNPVGWVDPWGLAVVDASFEIQGKVFSGVNPLDRNPRTSEPIEGLSNVNNNKYKMHAEIDAMTKAFDSGLRGGKATLSVQGKNVCGYCKGNIKKMAIKLGLEELTVIDADKKVYTFTTDELKPIKKGGKGWKSQCNTCICS